LAFISFLADARRAWAASLALVKARSSGGAAVPMMEAAEVGCGDHAAVRRWLNLSRHRRVAVQRLRGTRGVVVLEVLGQNALQMASLADANRDVWARPGEANPLITRRPETERQGDSWASGR